MAQDFLNLFESETRLKTLSHEKLLLIIIIITIIFDYAQMRALGLETAA